jgi:hypothetical protein
VSRRTFDTEVLPELRVTRIGRRWIIPVKSLESWLDKRAAVPLGSELER